MAQLAVVRYGLTTSSRAAATNAGSLALLLLTEPLFSSLGTVYPESGDTVRDLKPHVSNTEDSASATDTH
jgi:hypothetical protein